MSDDYMQSIFELVNEAESSGSSGFSGGNYLGETLGAALATLAADYGVTESAIPAPDEMGEEYAKMFGEVAENFSTLFSELNSIRSSYLPFELAQEIPTASGDNLTFAEIIDTEAVLESYENAFFRMLGMPSAYDLPDNVPLFAVHNNGVLRQEDFGLYEEQYTAEVLDVRQLSRTSRPIQQGNGIYDFLGASHDPIARLTRAGFSKAEAFIEIIEKMKILYDIEDPASEGAGVAATALLSVIKDNYGDNESTVSMNASGYIDDYLKVFGPTGDSGAVGDPGVALRLVLENVIPAIEPSVASAVTPDMINRIYKTEVLGEVDSTLMSLHVQSNFWKFAYLLFPPVQDGRIAKCINEPNKMIAEPFLPSTLRTINGRTMKSTLLEAVLRIRLDAVTGTTIEIPDPSSTVAVAVGVQDKNISYKDIQEEMGLLEALIITRLFSALHGFAIDVREKISEMHFLQHQSGIAPAPEGDPSSDNERTNSERRSFCEQDNERCRLETIKTIEDSLLLLLGDTGAPGALSLQEGVSRNSGVRNAHLMSAVLAIIDVPRRWATAQLGRLDEAEALPVDKAAEPARSQIASKLGVSKGVGAIDVLAFLIAFFTASEKTLLSLLTEQQFSYLKAEFPRKFFDDYKRDSQELAINEIGLRAYDSYQLFRYTLSNPGGVFVFSAAQNTSGPDNDADE